MKNKSNLESAVAIVNEAIAAETKRLEAIVRENDDTRYVEATGMTTTSHEVMLSIPAARMARIALRYNWPVHRVLGDELEDGMWEEMGAEVGLPVLCSINL